MVVYELSSLLVIMSEGLFLALVMCSPDGQFLAQSFEERVIEPFVSRLCLKDSHVLLVSLWLFDACCWRCMRVCVGLDKVV